MPSPDPIPPLGRRAFLGGALLTTLAWTAPTGAAVDLADRLAALPDDADDERLAHAIRGALLDVDDDAWRRGDPTTARTRIWSRGPIRLDHVALAPRATIGPEWTPDTVTVTRTIGGLARFALHDPLDDGPDGVFVVRRTREGVLVPGRLVDGTPRRDTIRSLRAGHDGAEFLEVRVERGEASTPRAVDVARTPHEAFEGLYAARWLDDDAAR